MEAEAANEGLWPVREVDVVTGMDWVLEVYREPESDAARDAVPEIMLLTDGVSASVRPVAVTERLPSGEKEAKEAAEGLRPDREVDSVMMVVIVLLCSCEREIVSVGVHGMQLRTIVTGS